MSLSRYAKRRDSSEADIIEALRSAGARVWQLDRPFDLLVGFRGQFTLLECKTGRKPLSDEQQQEQYRCQLDGLRVYVARSVDDALRLVGAVT